MYLVQRKDHFLHFCSIFGQLLKICITQKEIPTRKFYVQIEISLEPEVYLRFFHDQNELTDFIILIFKLFFYSTFSAHLRTRITLDTFNPTWKQSWLLYAVSVELIVLRHMKITFEPPKLVRDARNPNLQI